MKRLHLLVGGLGSDNVSDFPHLARLIARARPAAGIADAGPSGTLARLFGVEPRDLAAIRLAGEGIEPDGRHWFCADPVHLLAGMRSLSLLDGRHFSLDADEARQLVETLNAHFAGEIEFIAPHPQRWYARFRHTPVVDIPPLDQVAGTTLTPELIAGPDARALQRAGMEIQMLLHEHPVNDARESRNEVTVNSLWFWGGGAYRKPPLRFDRVLADDFTARALGRATGSDCAALPGAYEDRDGDVLAVLDPKREGLDSRWFRPVLSALRRGRLRECVIEAAGPAGFPRRLTPLMAWALWRR